MDVPNLKVDFLGLLSFAIAIIFTLVVRFLNLREDYERPTIYSQGGRFCEDVMDRCTKFKEIYYPTVLWGRSGHMQTILHAVFGRFGNRKQLRSKLFSLKAADGATVSYNIFNPETQTDCENSKDQHMILIIPGIANHSQNTYIAAFTALLLENQYNVAVLNHLGALPKKKLTSPRIFTYGCTVDLALVVEDILLQHKPKKIIGIGFSLGGNLLLKYLGEVPQRQQKFACALSICQGYDVLRAAPMLLEWKGLRRFYNWGMCRNIKRLLLGAHRRMFSQFEKRESGVKLDWKAIMSASSMQELDEAATRRFANFENLEEFYKWCSSANYMQKLKLPVLMLNAADDPLIPEELYKSPLKLVENNENAVFVVTKHGGHLGFFEGGNIFPHKDTWLDHALLQYIQAFEAVYPEQDFKSL